MSEKLYKDCPKSYQLLCPMDDKEAISLAMSQLSVDHPEVFTLDDLYEKTCLFMVKKTGNYVLKNPGPGVTLLEDQKKGWKRNPSGYVYSDVVLRIHLEHVHVFVDAATGKGKVEVLGDKRRAIIERMKLNPDFLGHVRETQARILAKKNQSRDRLDDMIYEGMDAVEKEMMQKII
jgi:hypothetical protein